MNSQPTVEVAKTEAEIHACLTLRRQVFVVEQEIPSELEADGRDGEALHALVRDGTHVVATGRVLVEVATRKAVAGRIAVASSHRGKGLGPRIIHQLEALARERGAEEISLEPHRHLRDFYQRLGYRLVEGEERCVGMHDLVTMVKPLAIAEVSTNGEETS